MDLLKYINNYDAALLTPSLGHNVIYLAKINSLDALRPGNFHQA